MVDFLLNGLIQNIAFLLVFSFLYAGRTIDALEDSGFLPKLLGGMVLGLFTVLLMLTPWVYVPGIVFDTRSILLAIAGFYLGAVPTVVGMVIALVYRFSLGGEGVLMGMSVILLSGTLGLFYRKVVGRLKLHQPVLRLLVLGTVVHIGMLACTLFLPREVALRTASTIALPVLVVYPLATVLLGLLMNRNRVHWDNQRAKDQLIESEKRFSDLLRNINLFSVIIDNQQRIVFCNDYFFKVTGFTPGELIGENWFEKLVLADDKETVLKTFGRVMQGKENFVNARNLIRTKEGKPLMVAWFNTLLKDANNRVVGTASIGENVTEKERMIAELRSSEEKFNHLFQSSPDAITLVRMSDWRIQEMNSSTADLTGYSEAELTGSSLFLDDLWHTADEARSFREMIRGSGYVLNREVHLKTKQGVVLTILVSAKEIQIGEEAFLITVFHNVSEIVEAQNLIQEKSEELIRVNQKLSISVAELQNVNLELRRAKDKAEESNRLKSVFLQNVSHEIRTPMNGILGFLDLLRDSDQDDSTKDYYLDLVKSSSLRLMYTVNDLIEISKIETKQISPTFTAFKISEWIQYHFLFYQNLATGKGLKINVDRDLIQSPLVIRTDRRLADSILGNLLSNAVKYTERGEIRIKGSCLDGTLLVSVEDTGIGIPQGRQDAIFDRFVQADLGNARAHEGAGLGLSIARSYCRVLGGDLRVESEVQQGSTFHFFFPVEVTPVQEDKGKGGDWLLDFSPRKPSLILVAEDDDISFEYIQTLLRQKSIQVLRARNGLEALGMLQDQPGIDLVVMDIRMPEMSGEEATREIRKFNATIPVIAQTAYAMAGDRKRLMEAGCSDYISKPVRYNDLMGVLQKYL
ncbi:MAG: PAS domain S-box protein [Bacteroidales bacterium]